MSTYVAEFVADYHRLGAERLGRELMHSVLILQGVTGTLRDSARSGNTLITDLNDTLTLSKLVGRVFELTKSRTAKPGPVLVGRSSESDVAIADYSISARHCFFVLGGREVQIGDSGSTNGTFVEGKQLLPKQLMNLQGGEKIVMGRFQFLFLRPAGFMEYLARQ